MVLPSILEHRLLHYSWVFIIVFTCKTLVAAMKSLLNEGKWIEVNDDVLGPIFICLSHCHIFTKALKDGNSPALNTGKLGFV